MKPSVLFWVIGVLGLLFNLAGFAQMALFFSGSEAVMASLSNEQLAYFEALPGWRSIVWVLGVSTALIASVLMLLRRSAAAPVMFFGLVMLLIGIFHDASLGWFDLVGSEGAITYIVVASGVSFLWLYARRQNQKGVLR
ncbi:MAG: hypothetical protein AAFX52_05750 [Pseudomonadota bacterium]